MGLSDYHSNSRLAVSTSVFHCITLSFFSLLLNYMVSNHLKNLRCSLMPIFSWFLAASSFHTLGWFTQLYRHTVGSLKIAMEHAKFILVGGWALPPLKNMNSSVGSILPNIWEKCSKPPASIDVLPIKHCDFHSGVKFPVDGITLQIGDG